MQIYLAKNTLTGDITEIEARGPVDAADHLPQGNYRIARGTAFSEETLLVAQHRPVAGDPLPRQAGLGSPPFQIMFAPHLPNPSSAGGYEIENAPPGAKIDARNGVVEVHPAEAGLWQDVITCRVDTKIASCRVTISSLDLYAIGARGTIVLYADFPYLLDSEDVSFEVERSATDGIFTGTPTISGLGSPHYNDTVATGARHAYRMRAVGAVSGAQPWSVTVWAKEQADNPMAVPASLTSIQMQGETATFDAAHTVCYDVMGVPYVVSARAGRVRIGPPSQPVLHPANGVPLQAYGTMKNPWTTSGSGRQGLDELAAYGEDSTTRVPYDPALNVDAAATWNAGEACVFLKGYRRRTDASEQWPMDKYVALNVLPYPLPANAYLPGLADRGRAMIFTEAQLSMDAVRTLPWPEDRMEPFGLALDSLPAQTTHLGWNGEQRNTLTPDGAYAVSWYRTRKKGFRFAHSSADADEKLAVLRRLNRMAIDGRASMVRPGSSGPSNQGAGQWHGDHFPQMAAGFVLRDLKLLDAALTMSSNVTSHQLMTDNIAQRYIHWVTEELVGLPVLSYRQEDERYGGSVPYLPDHIGLPQKSKGPEFGRPIAGLHPEDRYNDFWWSEGTDETFLMALLQNSPEGVDGETLLSRGRPLDTSNPWGAIMAGAWEGLTFRELNAKHADIRAFAEAWARPNLTPWTGKPYPLMAKASSGAVTTPTDNTIGYDFKGDRQSTLPVTKRTLWVSQDGGRQFHGFDDLPDIGAIADLTPGPYIVHMEKWNAAGRSGRGLEARLDVTGADPVAAIAKVADPIVAWRPYKAYPEYFEAVEEDDTITVNEGRVYGGIGFWRAPAGTLFGRSWLRDGAVIANETGDTYMPAYEDFPADGQVALIQHRVTAARGGDVIVATSVPVRLPSRRTELTYDFPSAEDFFARWSIRETGGNRRSTFETVEGVFSEPAGTVSFYDGSSSSFPRLYTIDQIDNFPLTRISDAEVVVAFTVDRVYDGVACVMARVQDGDAFRDGYYVRLQKADPEIAIIRREDDADTVLAEAALPELRGGDWQDGATWCRLRLSGPLLQARVWRAEDPEPVGWQAEASDATFADGRLGLGAHGRNRVDFARLGVGLGGHPAPLMP